MRERARPAVLKVSTGRVLACRTGSVLHLDLIGQCKDSDPEDAIYFHTGCKPQVSVYSEFGKREKNL